MKVIVFLGSFCHRVGGFTIRTVEVRRATIWIHYSFAATVVEVELVSNLLGTM